MTTINIADFIGTPNAIIQKFGLQVFDEASKIIANEGSVCLNFRDLKNTTTGFFHASIGNLFKQYGDAFYNVVIIKGMDKNEDWQEKYNESIMLVRNPKQASEIDFAIAKLFE